MVVYCALSPTFLGPYFATAAFNVATCRPSTRSVQWIQKGSPLWDSQVIDVAYANLMSVT
ncbi:hypothetical protein HPB50_026357 [Hyalomma asiaticum]|uniref:Uncharacterized protein n=1 Tax=Hyalomma asiaticum TaxID=266040 RepID=A0ACB7T872_HYAAI|nr:hypothetical protein HPB50_026357 [Hyalomma asiaticum]